jgi:hypothetical protein
MYMCRYYVAAHPREQKIAEFVSHLSSMLKLERATLARELLF